MKAQLLFLILVFFIGGLLILASNILLRISLILLSFSETFKI